MLGSIDLTARCPSPISTCSLSNATVALAPGATVDVTLTYTTAATVGARNVAAVVGTWNSQPGVADSAWTEVEILAAPAAGARVVSTGKVVSASTCASAQPTPEEEIRCGDLFVAHAFPGARVNDTYAGPVLLYRSQAARPRPVVAMNVTLPTRNGHAATTVAATLKLGTTTIASGSWSGTQWNGAGSTRRIGLAPDMTAYGSGARAVTITMTYTYPGGATTTETLNDTLAVVNRSTSAYGAGWWLVGQERLLRVDGSRLWWIDGDGSARLYTRDAVNTSVYRAPAADLPDSVVAGPGGIWTRRTPSGATVRFDPYGRHEATTSLRGDSLRYAYTGTDSASAVASLTRYGVSASQTWTFSYANQAIANVTAPGNRVTTITATSGVITRIIAPDTGTIQLAYGTGTASTRLRSRTDVRQYTSDMVYDTLGRIQQVSRTMADGSVALTTWRDASMVGVASGPLPTAQPLDSVFTRIVRRRSSTVSDTMQFWVDSLWVPRVRRDGVGRFALSRPSSMWPLRATEWREPHGSSERVVWSATRGLVDSVVVRDPAGTGVDAVTTVQWDTRFARPTSVSRPLEEPWTAAYDGRGNRTWEQPGLDTLRRIRYDYASSGHLLAIRAPLVAPESLFVDALGNLSRWRQSTGASMRWARDGLGRDTLRVVPIAAGDTGISNAGDAARLRERLRYSVMDRVDTLWSLNPTVSTGCLYCDATSHPADTLRVVNAYDKGGLLLTVGRTGSRTATGLSAMDSYFQYDALWQRTSEDHGSGPTQTTYDLASSVVSSRTPDNRTTTFVLDRAGQLRQRIVPSVFYGAASCVAPGIPDTNGRHSPCYIAYDTLRIAVDTSFFTYDQGGRLRTANNRWARISRNYTPAGWTRTDTLSLRRYVPTTTSAFGVHVFGMQMRYDVAGRRLSLRAPAALAPSGADSLRYSYTGFGALEQVLGFDGESYSATYDAALRVGRLAMPSASDSVTYTAAGDLQRRLVRLSGGSAVIDDSLTWDPRGKLVAAASRGTLAGGAGFARAWYTGRGDLAASEWQQLGNAGARTDEYLVDVHGSVMRTHQVTSTAQNDTIVYTYDGAGRVVTAGNASGLLLPRARWSYRDYSPLGGRQTYSAEKQGASQSGDRTYYDAANQLRLVQREGLVPGGAIKLKEEMWYDALGRRVLVRAYRTGNCTTSDGSCAETIARFIWDGAQILGELRANGATGAPLEIQVSAGTYTGRVRYVHAPDWRGIDAPLSASKDGTLIVPHADWRGLPLAGSTASGALASTGIAWPGAAARIRIDPAMPLAEWWGTLLADQQDATGRRYRRARYYDPAIGQFASEDPIGLAGGRHPYAYADGDPVNYSDPFGLWPCPELCSGAIAGGGAMILGGFGSFGGTFASVGVGSVAGTGAGLAISGAVALGLGLSRPMLPGAKINLGRGTGTWASEATGVSFPELPDGLTGTQDRRSKPPHKTTGTGNPEELFGRLSGGQSTILPDGSRVAPNGVRIRTGKDGGIRISIPAKGDRGHEDVHFPPSNR